MIKANKTAFFCICRMARNVKLMPRTKAKYWYNSSQSIGPNWVGENGEKGRKSNLDLSQFLALLRPFKATKQLLGVCRMASGVTWVPKNAQNIILVLYKSKY